MFYFTISYSCYNILDREGFLSHYESVSDHFDDLQDNYDVGSGHHREPYTRKTRNGQTMTGNTNYFDINIDFRPWTDPEEWRNDIEDRFYEGLNLISTLKY